MSIEEAVSRFVRHDDTVYLAGFTHLIPFAAGHEIIRQGLHGLVLACATPDLIYDHMIAAGCARKLIFSWSGNPGVGSLWAVGSAIEGGTIEIEEYTHFAMLARLAAGASGLPFLPLRSVLGSDLMRANSRIREIQCPCAGERIAVVPPFRPDVTVLHAQRADAEGNVQLWGILGEQKEAAFAARRVVVTVEEIVPHDVIAGDPNRTMLPGFLVDAVVEEPWGAHPSYVQGYYDRDNEFYVDWNETTREPRGYERWLAAWVRDVPSWREYVRRLSEGRLARLRVGPRYSSPVNYGGHG